MSMEFLFNSPADNNPKTVETYVVQIVLRRRPAERDVRHRRRRVQRQIVDAATLVCVRAAAGAGGGAAAAAAAGAVLVLLLNGRAGRRAAAQRRAGRVGRRRRGGTARVGRGIAIWPNGTDTKLAFWVRRGFGEQTH